MENMGIEKLIKELKRRNPDIVFSFKNDTYPTIIIASQCSDCAKLNLPTGYYYCEKNVLTNKHNTASGIYEHFQLMTEYEYLRELC